MENERTTELIARMTDTLRHTFVYMTLSSLSSPFSVLEEINEIYRFRFSGKLCFFMLTATSKLSDHPVNPQWLDDANQHLHAMFDSLPGDFETIREGESLYCLTGFSLPEEEQIRYFHRFFNSLADLSGTYTCAWTMGVGAFAEFPADLRNSVLTAQHALKLCITQGTGHLYDANNQTVIFEGGLTILSPSEELSVKHLVEKQKNRELGEKIANLFAAKQDQIQTYPTFAYMLSLQMQKVVIQTLREIMPVDRSTYELSLKNETAVDGILVLEALIEHTVLSCQALCRRYSQFLTGGRSRPIWLVINYIQAHYTENISLEDLSLVTQRNPQYISAVFSKECGISLKEYITSLRMDEAKRLLRSTGLPISEIAQRTGYQDAKYFSRIFQKKTSMSPRDYRGAETLSE